MRHFKIWTSATIISLGLLLATGPVLWAKKKITDKDICEGYAYNVFASCTANGGSIEYCAQAANRRYDQCMQSKGHNAYNGTDYPPPPKWVGLQPPPTVGANPGPNTTTLPPQNVLEALTQMPGDPCNWGGFYIGFNNGATFTKFDVSKQKTDLDLSQQFYEMLNAGNEGGDGVQGEETAFTTFHIPGHSETDTQTIGGGQTGFNLQFGHIVVGAEGGFQGNGSDTKSKSHQFQENTFFPFTEQAFITADTDFHNERMVETTWNANIGGHVGVCLNRFLVYLAGGAAFTDAHFSSMDIADTSFFGFIGEGGPPGAAAINSPRARRLAPAQETPFIGEIVSKHEQTSGDVLTGYYAGGGVMYQLTNLVSVGLEYKHTDWGDVTEHLMGGNGPVFSGNGKVGLSAEQVLFKVNIIVGPFSH